MLSRDLALALDPVRLMEAVHLSPDNWQIDLLRGEPRRALLLCSRQAGKSTVTAVMALHEALYGSGALVLLLSPSQRQSGELFRKVVGFYRQLGETIPIEAESALRLELANGSRIASLPGQEQTVRGFSGVRLLIIDEAARVPDELYYSVRPMLAVSGGRLVALSTPFGKRGFFFHEWTEGAQEWARIKVTARECPRIAPAFLDVERRSLGEWWYRQEYECEFVETVDQVFRYEHVMGALCPDVLPLFGSET